MEIGILNILDKKDISAERITYSGAYPFTFRQLIRV